MARKRIKVEIILKDNRRLVTSLKLSQAKVLGIVNDAHPNKIFHVEIGSLYKPESWGSKRLNELYHGSIEMWGKGQADQDREMQTQAIESAVSSIISNIKRGFRSCRELTEVEIQLGFPFNCPVGSRKVASLHPIIKSITFESSSD